MVNEGGTSRESVTVNLGEVPDNDTKPLKDWISCLLALVIIKDQTVPFICIGFILILMSIIQDPLIITHFSFPTRNYSTNLDYFTKVFTAQL